MPTWSTVGAQWTEQFPQRLSDVKRPEPRRYGQVRWCLISFSYQAIITIIMPGSHRCFYALFICPEWTEAPPAESAEKGLPIRLGCH